MKPGSGPGSAELSIVRLPTFAKSGQWAARVVPKFASASEQDVLPSAAFELIEKPSGNVTVAPRSSVGEGIVGLNCWGTERFTSIPDAESVAFVVGWA